MAKYPLHGTQCSNCGWSPGQWLAPFASYVVQAGDSISWRQLQAGTATGGPTLVFSDASTTSWVSTDSAGQLMNAMSGSGQWTQRTVDLSAFANKTAVSLWLGAEGTTSPGDWDEYFADMVINTADGRVIPVYNGQSSMSLTAIGLGAMTNLSAVVDTAPDPGLSSLHYFLDDHLGTTQVEVGASGVPLWLGQFTPYGQELPDGPTAMHYKFTGKERDAESGLDYFGARYYASTMGRWMSPDWSAKPEAVPYSSLDNPQSLNLYGYVLDNPLSKADPDGHQQSSDCPCDQVKQGFAQMISNALDRLPTVTFHFIPIAGPSVTVTVPTITFKGNDAPGPATPAKGEKTGEPPQLSAGREAHNNEEVRPGEKPEVPTPSKTGRMDRYDAEKGHIREIKPDNPRGEKAGQKQLSRYKAEMEKATGKPHTTELTKYPPPTPKP